MGETAYPVTPSAPKAKGLPRKIVKAEPVIKTKPDGQAKKDNVKKNALVQRNGAARCRVTDFGEFGEVLEFANLGIVSP